MLNDCVNREILEYKKWLEYEPYFEKKVKSDLYSTDTNYLSEERKSELEKYLLRDYYSDIFKKYCSDPHMEHLELMVRDYMDNYSVEEIMVDKLTGKEIKFGLKKYFFIRDHFSKKEMYQLIQEQYSSSCYLDLSMVDSYVLYLVYEYYHHLKKGNIKKKTKKVSKFCF